MTFKKIFAFALAILLLAGSALSASALAPPYSANFENEADMLTALSDYAEEYPYYDGFSFKSDIPNGYHREYRQVLSVDIDITALAPEYFSFAESKYGQGVDYTFTSFGYELGASGALMAFVYYGYNSDEVLAQLENAKTKEGVSTFDEGVVYENPYVICESFKNCEPPRTDYYFAADEYLIHIISYDEMIVDFLNSVFIDYTDVYIPVKIKDNADWLDKTIENSYVIGDANADGELNIKDATALQKYCAKMAMIDKTVSDFNGDIKINVKDATEIQKKLAGLNYTCKRELYPAIKAYVGTDDEHFVESVSYGVGPFSSGELSLINDSGDGNIRKYTTVFNSVEEFKAFFGVTLDRFDEEFFRDKSLVYLYRWYGSSSESIEPDRLYFADGVLNIRCVRDMPGDDEAWQTAIANYNIYFEVDKSDIEGLKGIVVTEYFKTRK